MDDERRHTRELDRRIERLSQRMEATEREMVRRVEEMRRSADSVRERERRSHRPEGGAPGGEPGSDPRVRRRDTGSPVRASGEHTVAVDLLDRGEEFVLTATVPGFTPDEIDVRLIDDVVRIDASHEETEEREEEGRYLARERRRSMSRSVPLGAPVDDDAELSARYKNGILTVRLPKAERTDESGRRIDVE